MIELFAIFYFIEKITILIELRVKDGKNLNLFFPKQPACFMLSDEAKNNYLADCDITDANTKMLNLMRNFEIFNIQMESNLSSYRSSKMWYKIVSKDSFALYTRVIWFLALCMIIFMSFVV